MTITIAGLKFDRIPDSDAWMSEDDRLQLVMDMSTPEHPWRITVDGHGCKSPYSTAYVAVKRTLQRRKQYEMEMRYAKLA
jgi:hypothetical protein